jgi:glycosyltransferase A (GT-A) superfamily protein (DUF2064 family)
MAEENRGITQNSQTAVARGSHAVVVMAKAPLSGAVKSRLVPPLTEDEAAALNRCFIRDVCASIEAAAAIIAAIPDTRVTDARVAAGKAAIADGNTVIADLSASVAQDRANVAAMIARPPAGAPPAPIVAAAGNAKVVGMIAYTPAGAQAAFDGLVPASFKFIAQRGEGLTARLTNVAADLLAAGYKSVSLMNSDSPTIPPALIAQAVTHLIQAGDRSAHPEDDHLTLPDNYRVAGADDHLAQPRSDRLAQTGDRLAIIGADDGGYCLIGLKRPHWRVFEEIAWSTGAVLAQTLQRAAELRLLVLQTPLWYDIDDAGSLRRLISDLFGEFSGNPLPSEKSLGRPSGTYSLRQEALIEQLPNNPPGVHPLGREAPSENRKSEDQAENRRSQNKANPFAAPATRAWLSEALANGLAARLGLAASAHSAGPPPRDRRGPDE